MLFYLDHFMEIWLLPPGSNITLLLIGSVLWRFKPAFGKTLIAFSMLSLWMLSTPFIAQQLLNQLQNQYPALSPDSLSHDKNTAIVALEAGLNFYTPEYGKATVSESTLTRLRYSAFLHEKTKLPILVSGNDPSHPDINQADYMANALKEYFSAETRWKESRGYNTAKEGILTAKILKKDGITKIYLVTHAFHMPRAVYSFKNNGLEVIPAPTGYRSFDTSLGKLSAFLPSTEALSVSSLSLREYIGMIWYKIYYRF